MNEPFKCLAMLPNGAIACPEKVGFWALDRYPWGGEFHRFQVDCICSVERIIDTYNDGSPKRVIALMGKARIGLQF